MTAIYCDACKVEHEVEDTFNGVPVVRCPMAPPGDMYLSQHPTTNQGKETT